MSDYMKLLKVRVFSVEEGMVCGKIIDFLIDYEKFEVFGFIVKGGWNKDAEVALFKDLESVGEDVIMVKNAKSVQPASKVPEALEAIKNRIDITKLEVITTKGQVLGKVSTFEFSTDTGKIDSFEIEGAKYIERLMNFFEGRNTVPVSRIVSIGRDAIIVKDQKEEQKKQEKKSVKADDAGKKTEKKSSSSAKKGGAKTASKSSKKKTAGKQGTAKKTTAKKKSTKKKSSAKKSTKSRSTKKKSTGGRSSAAKKTEDKKEDKPEK
jgi:uncharacterized protein YrrD